MKKNNILVLLIGLFSFLSYNHFEEPAQNGLDMPFDACSVANETFNVGEEITYKIYYNLNFIWLPAGEVTFRIKENETHYHISAAGRTYPSYEWFFKVRDYFETYVDKNTMLPDTFVREVNEGSFTMYNKMVFDQENKTITSTKGKTKENTKTEVVDFDGCMHDIMSIVYCMRNKFFDKNEKGKKMPIEVALDGEVYPLKVVYSGDVKNKKVKGQGRFNLHQFDPEVIAGSVFNENAKMKVWVSADENKIPVLIESPVSVGSVKVVLKDHKNLKYELSSKTK